MLDRLDELEIQSRQLDPSVEVFDGWMDQTKQLAGHRFLAELNKPPQ